MQKYKVGDFIVFDNKYATVISIVDDNNSESMYELYYIQKQADEHYWAVPIRWVDEASRLPTATERLLYGNKV